MQSLSYEVFSYFKTTITSSPPAHPEFIFMQEPCSERYKSKYTFMVLLHAQQEPSNKEKVAQEVRDVVGINHEANIDEFVANITDAALEQMHHLHATLTETLRLYLVVPLVRMYVSL